jgi:hypothetical protein
MLTIASLAAFGTLGCEREGPLERAGEEIDEAGEEVKDELDDATDDR